MTVEKDGLIYWSRHHTNPLEKRPFAFSKWGAAKAKREYETVRDCLRSAIRLPDADRRAVYEIRKLLQSPDFKPIRSPFICWLTAEQWRYVSRALRDWRTDGQASKLPEYQLMVRAKARGMEVARDRYETE